GIVREHAQPAVEVGAGADLEPAPASLQMRPVGEQLGGVEVDRLVVEGALAVDLQDLELRPQLADQEAEGGGRYEVLAVHPDLKVGGLDEVVQRDRTWSPRRVPDGVLRAVPPMSGEHRRSFSGGVSEKSVRAARPRRWR